MDKPIQEIEEQTKEEDYTEGCFRENYMVPHVCPIATGGWCRDYVKCRCMEEGIMRKIREQQAHNQNIQKEEKETPAKRILLTALLIFIILCCIMVTAGIMELLCCRLLTGRMAWINGKEPAVRLMVYAVIGLLAAGIFYYITKGGTWNECNTGNIPLCEHVTYPCICMG